MKYDQELAIEIYEYILDYKSDHDGCSPTIREICGDLDINSTAIPFHYINRMIERGLLNRIDRKLCVVGGKWRYEPDE